MRGVAVNRGTQLARIILKLCSVMRGLAVNRGTQLARIIRKLSIGVHGWQE